MGFVRQTWALTAKNLRIIAWRQLGPTSFTALTVPIALALLLSFTPRFAASPSTFGIATPTPIRTLGDALDAAAAASGTRGSVVFANSNHSGGLIDLVIDQVAAQVEDVGSQVVRVSDAAELRDVCRASNRGVTACFAAVVFNTSPEEGGDSLWNYTLRGDNYLGGRIDVTKNDNNAQIYTLPLQKAIDSAIVKLSGPNGASELPAATNEYAFTALTQDEQSEASREAFQSSVISYMAVALMTVFVGACYHVAAFVSTEREIGMSQLLEATMPVTRHWEAQAARFISYHLAFTLVYLPGWVISSILLGRAIFPSSNVGVVLIYFILFGIALISMSILGATFFRKSQLSGLSLLLYTVLAIIAQTIPAPGTAGTAILSILFAPCNFVYFITWVARWERVSSRLDLTRASPDSPSALPGIVLWVFLLVQIPLYPLIGAFVERSIHGSAAKGRNTIRRHDPGADYSGGAAHGTPAVQITNFTKVYQPGPLRKLLSWMVPAPQPVVAVARLNLRAERGQILALLGTNGSGKSTTLDTISGMNSPTKGSVEVDITGGIGITPQKDVLWDDLSVFEHVQIFLQLKAPQRVATTAEVEELVAKVDLAAKSKSQSKTLSGGQKRKLQLAMMLAGGSAVCCVDEVSSALDPLSRRKVWDILLAERGQRTIIMTTHFLDEADVLADRIAVLSKGRLRAEGFSAELKDKHGTGHKISVPRSAGNFGQTSPPSVRGVDLQVSEQGLVYTATSTAALARVIRTLEDAGCHDYEYSGPTLESVFLKLADEFRREGRSQASATRHSPRSGRAEEVAEDFDVSSSLEFLSGRPVGVSRQTLILLRKRCTIFKSNWLPYLAALAIPLVVAGIITLFIRDNAPPTCTPADASTLPGPISLSTYLSNDASMVVGPESAYNDSELSELFTPLVSTGSQQALVDSIRPAGSIGNFNSLVSGERKLVRPAGWWLGDAASTVPTLAYLAGAGDVSTSVIGQNALNVMLSNVSIATSYAPFETPSGTSPGTALQLMVYLSLALAVSTAFFGLYPNLERRQQIRSLQYSNGVLPVALWTSHVVFDFAIVVVVAAVITCSFVGTTSAWYHIGYLFPVLMLYGLASILLAYVLSLFISSQASTFGWASGAQGFGALMYFIVYNLVTNFTSPSRVESTVLVVHFVISLFAPTGSIMRAMMIALNVNMVSCTNGQLASNPAALTLYGGPIVVLVLQCILLYSVLLWHDAGVGAGASTWPGSRKANNNKQSRQEKKSQVAGDPTGDCRSSVSEGDTVASDVATAAAAEGLRVVHLSKEFTKGKKVVDDVTFGVSHDETLALLGPNGAGKSVTIAMVRGDVRPTKNKTKQFTGDVEIEGASITTQLAAARSHLGVCPQVDALDLMTVAEHLRFYARIRGVSDIERSTLAVLHAVGLSSLASRPAHALSGGGKRKLSLGIALMGNSTVLVLDEPSASLDAAAKRDVWRTLKAVSPGRAVLLTTHSMEEAGALASRVAILARHMLAVGTPESLRRRFSNTLHVHLVCRGAPHSRPEEMSRVREWVSAQYGAAAEIDGHDYHGQPRFSVSTDAVLAGGGAEARRRGGRSMGSAIGQLIVDIELAREQLGVVHFAVSHVTLDQVFLNIVGQHNVQEENSEVAGEGKEKKDKSGFWSFGRS
ncbi:P-loop containing nucleoside triphosphate hydrolase protein [Microdochium trichocladiopsis]|uniref:P-loop containing nucleoside triphosphate hydrolase protein n=1 Tax=Microdochium trichocladiopsis TaxID=1682393 RepID=A0A9P9BJI3_9PEZI|nr:P-loop containing nucleoside triphosphate hydrolase protein [Microdochium trichocladiopsis]KAH7025268.1 P-loop containing nucleoside triphosphate hydrolase protein [Microdochium trichocladiopsis]